MATGKTRTDAQKERDKDKRLRKTYGISLAEYNLIFEAQGGRCAICGREPKDKPLNVDHLHFKITTSRVFTDKQGNPVSAWLAITTINGVLWARCEKTKVAAVQELKKVAMRASVRGLLCPGRYFGCNRKLGGIDSIPWLQNSLTYLQTLPARKVLDNSKVL